MSAPFPAVSRTSHGESSADHAPLLPRISDGHDPVTTAWWALDITEARPVIAAIASGTGPVNWVSALLAGVRIADIDQNNFHLIGPYAARESMIGQLFTAYCPPESWQIGAELILAATANYPPGAPLARPITSLAFSDAWARAEVDHAHPDIVFVAVGGTVADDRSLWAVRASEDRYRNLIHHLPWALLQVDSRPMRPIFDELRGAGADDITPHLEDTPELSLHSRQIVQVTDANHNAVMLFGVETSDQLIGPVDFVFAQSPASAGRVIAAHFSGVRTYREIMKIRRFDGEVRDVELTVTYPQPPERVDVTLLSLEDITDRLRTEAQLRELQADYSRAARISTLGELASSIAHEVSQPLSAIVTNGETGLRWLSRREPNLSKVNQLVTRIVANARRASDTVQRIRDMVTPRAPEQAKLDLNAIVEESLLFVRYEIESRSITLSLHLGRDLPRLLGDRIQLQQVIVNLLLNAVQAIGQESRGCITIDTAVDAQGSISFGIRDNGPGIADENLDRLFSSFFTTKEEGMGIGLAICQSIITAHGGAITACNHPKGGALFRFRLPSVGG